MWTVTSTHGPGDRAGRGNCSPGVSLRARVQYDHVACVRAWSGESSEPVSDDVLSVIPADPRWQPDQAAADRTAAVVAGLVPRDEDVDIDVTWHETFTVVDCGQNLERIGCPQCGASIDTEWWADLLEAHCESGFATLAVEVPCCGAQSSLDALDYEWPCGFARFEIAIWNPERAWLTDEELTAVADALGHPVRQIRAHI
jgi:hypothetical protein